MNSDGRSYCRIFTHYAVQMFAFAELSHLLIATTTGVYFLFLALELVRILYLFLLCFCFYCVPFYKVSFLFFCILRCLKCPIIFLELYRFNSQLLTSLSDFVQELFRTVRLFTLFLDQHKQPLPFPPLVPLLAN